MKISINVPSWHRPNNVKTLDYIPFANIYVDESEAEAYRLNYPKANIIECPKGVQGNLCRVRNYIIRQTIVKGNDDVCLILDDDLHHIGRFEMRDGWGYNEHKLTADELNPFVEKYSVMAADLGAKFWGLNCTSDNMAYRHGTPFSTVSYIGGPFQCFLKGNRCYYDENLPLKEDYDMTLQQLNKERVVLRLNAYHYVSEQSTIAGGCATYRNRVREQQQFEALQKKWGTLIVTRDKSNKGKSTKAKPEDYNPIIHIPIKGV